MNQPTRPTHSRPTVKTALLLALALLLPWAVAAPAAAQLSNLDKGRLIDGLAKRGMRDLLLHLIKVDPPEDPVIARQVEIAQARLDFENPKLPIDQRLEALAKAREVFVKMIGDYRDNPRRPMWQTELAELLLTNKLGALHNRAAAFYEFGVTTDDQRAAYVDAAPAALRATADATAGFFELQGRLGRNQQLTEKLKSSGIYFRLFDDYRDQRTRYYYALAAYDTALLPDHSPYFRSIGQGADPRGPAQAKTPDAERQRLLQVVVDQLKPFVTDTADTAGIRFAAMSLTGRALLHMGRAKDADQDMLTPVLADAPAGLERFEAGLAQAQALFERDDPVNAFDKLVGLEGTRLARTQALMRLLVVDLHHRLLMRQAAKAPASRKAQAIAAAYQPYLNMFNTSSQSEGTPSPLRSYVYQRWADNLNPNTPLADLPAVVRMAVARVLRIQGQNQLADARQAKDPKAIGQAMDTLDRAIRVASTLKGSEAPPAAKAEGLYNLAMAKYLKQPQDLSNLLAVIDQMDQVARQMPDQPAATQAITDATRLAHSLYALSPRPRGAAAAYRKTVSLLLDQFPDTKAAADERVYYGFYVLEGQGDYDKAIEVFEQVSPDRPDYFAARREILFSRESLTRLAPEDQRPAMWARLGEEARKLERSARSSRDATPEMVQSAVAASQLVQADAAAAAGNIDRALSLLDGFADRFSDQPDMVRDALGRRISVLVAANQVDQAQQQAVAMMKRFPDDAAAVIDQVLDRLRSRIDDLRQQAEAAVLADQRAEFEQQATDKADIASKLAEVLVGWAAKQGYDASRMLPYNLLLVQSLRLSGKPEEALDKLQPLLAKFPNDVEVLNQDAETLYAKGTAGSASEESVDKTSLVKAAQAYDRLITGLQPPYPDTWWNAWMRRLQINDKLQQSTDDIPLRVRQLKRTDPNLGGDPYKSTLQALAGKYGGA